MTLGADLRFCLRQLIAGQLPPSIPKICLFAVSNQRKLVKPPKIVTAFIKCIFIENIPKIQGLLLIFVYWKKFIVLQLDFAAKLLNKCYCYTTVSIFIIVMIIYVIFSSYFLLYHQSSDGQTEMQAVMFFAVFRKEKRLVVFSYRGQLKMALRASQENFS